MRHVAAVMVLDAVVVKLLLLLQEEDEWQQL